MRIEEQGLLVKLYGDAHATKDRVSPEHGGDDEVLVVQFPPATTLERILLQALRKPSHGAAVTTIGAPAPNRRRPKQSERTEYGQVS